MELLLFLYNFREIFKIEDDSPEYWKHQSVNRCLDMNNLMIESEAEGNLYKNRRRKLKKSF